MNIKFIEAVAASNLMKVRIMLADELLLDPRGKTFKEMLTFAKQNLPNLFEDNKEANFVISPDRSTWNIDLVSEIKQDLISNFSIEKLALFQEVAMEVGKEKAKALAEEGKILDSHSYTSQSVNKTEPPAPISQARGRKKVDSLDNDLKTCHNVSTSKDTHKQQSHLGVMILKIFNDELARRLNLQFDYIESDSLDVKYDVEDVTVAEAFWDKWKKGALVDYPRSWSPSHRIKRFKVLRIIYCGVDDNIVKLKYSAKENILKNAYFLLLNDEPYVSINERAASIYIDLSKIKYFSALLSNNNTVQAINFRKNFIEIKIALQ